MCVFAGLGSCDSLPSKVESVESLDPGRAFVCPEQNSLIALSSLSLRLKGRFWFIHMFLVCKRVLYAAYVRDSFGAKCVTFHEEVFGFVESEADLMVFRPDFPPIRLIERVARKGGMKPFFFGNSHRAVAYT